jgi:predicted nucleotidyltransferase
MNFPIEQYTHYLVMSGSHSYGCSTPESDFDIRGWAIPPRRYFFSYHLNFDQADSSYTINTLPESWRTCLETYVLMHDCREPGEDEKIDFGVYNLRKFVKLAADCNPNIIELLFVDPAEVLGSTLFGNMLRKNAKLFLSARAKYSFSGYAISQLKRINTHRKWLMDPPTKKPERIDFGLPEKSLISADQRQAADALIQKQVRIWMLEEAEVDRTIVAMIQEDLRVMIAKIINEPMNLEAADRMIERVAAKEVGIGENYLEVLQLEKRYRQALNYFNQYQDWVKNRNPVRAELEKKFGMDTKHASHLFRLTLEAKDILFKGDLIVKDKERAQLLREVKNGAWTYDQLIDWTSKQMAELDAAYDAKTYKVPSKPDVNEIDFVYSELCEKALQEYAIIKSNFLLDDPT